MGVGPTQYVKEERASKNGQFCSQPAGLMPFPHAGLTTFRLGDNLQTVFSQVWPLATRTRII